MGVTKAQIYTKLEILLENHSISDILQLMADFMSVDEFERFLEHVKHEYQ